MVEQGAFRRDLYFRLNVVDIQLPPLRERRERIVPLFLNMVREESEYFKCPAPLPPTALLQRLMCHPWPGNVRELRSAAKRFVLGLPPLSESVAGHQKTETCLKERLQQIEKTLIEESLRRHDQCVDGVAVELGVAKRTLYYRMKQLDISLG
jgi:transcriptional regulator with PAS, ATPase and Fis domain